MKEEKIIGIIPARYGSERFPGKVLYNFKGKTILQHVYENACSIKSLSEIYIATDSEKIVEVAKKFGAKTIITSPSCRTGSDRVAEASKKLKCSIVVDIQADEPFLPEEAVEKPLKIMLEDKKIYITTSATKIRKKEELYDSNTVKVVLDNKNFALYFSRSLIPFPRSYFLKKNQFLKNVIFYKHIGVYLYRKNFLMKFYKMESSPLEKIEKLEQLRVLENGYKIKVAIIEKDSPSVDTLSDIKKLY